MSLQVWLPLTKDLRNQGLSSVTVTNNGATFNSVGKLGGCYILDGTNDRIQISNLPNPKDISVAFWMKRNADTGTRQFMFTAWNGVTCELQANNSFHCGVYNNGSTVGACSNTSEKITVSSGWVHVVYTFEDKVGGKLYLNGSLISTASYSGSIQWGTTTGNIGYYSTYFNGAVNDFRIYDHCLSAMEVKLLSQGLILHYPLNRGGLGPSNLITNGFGELGSENWSSSTSISTTDIPSGQPDIKASFDGNTVERVKIYPTHTYKLSAWIKATSTSGSTYPSLYPYDIDGNFISTYQCPEGFNLNTMTALRQQLKAGDTKIYVNDLSTWNANSGHYYNVAAIFDYVDSTGYIWPEGTYTRNCPAFASGTEAKTNLDKTNNVITLLSAYTGPTMPIGTKLCASTYGSTYFYPLGGIKLANIQDWTYKEGTFSGDNSRLRYAKTITFHTYGYNRMAGIKLEDITANNLTSNIEYDCSGFCNNGTKNGTYSYTSNTPKYAVSTNFSGTETIATATTGADILTLSCWAKTSKSSSASQMMVADSASKLCCSFYQGNFISFYGGNSDYSTGSRCLLGSEYKENEWNHFVSVKTGDGTRDCYCNGVKLTPTTNDWWSTATGFWIGNRNIGGNLPFYGQICDVRAYATALSADDVKALYKNSAYIDNAGNVYGVINEV